MTDIDVKYMQMALRLARRGLGSVEPNPLVGCLITKANQIIGKGWHRKFGGAHAEVAALEDCKNLGVSPRGATMYVTLEPCCHQGKTPPCTDAIIAAGIKRVVVATVDPSPYVAGKGIEQLRAAGIEVEEGLCQRQAQLLNAPFMKFGMTGRPWVILKWAQSIDGKLAWAHTTQDPEHDRRWISGIASRRNAHVLRRRAQAIVVGINTVLADDPLLTPRPAKGKKPIRVVLDSYLRTPLSCRLVRTARRVPVLIYCSQRALAGNPKAAERLEKKEVQVLPYPQTDRSNLHFLLEQLGQQGIQQVLVEGGAAVLGSFLKEGLADELCIYIAAKLLGQAGSVPLTTATIALTDALALQAVRVERFGDDVCVSGFTQRALAEIGLHQGDGCEKV